MAKKVTRKSPGATSRTKPTLADQLRKAIKDSGLSTYAVAKGSGLSYAATLRFITCERDLFLSSATKLTHFFGMELTEPKLP